MACVDTDLVAFLRDDVKAKAFLGYADLLDMLQKIGATFEDWLIADTRNELLRVARISADKGGLATYLDEIARRRATGGAGAPPPPPQPELGGLGPLCTCKHAPA